MDHKLVPEPETVRRMLEGLTGKKHPKPRGRLLTIGADKLQTGDFIRFGKTEYVFEQYDEANPIDLNTAQGLATIYSGPQKKRELADIVFSDVQYPLKRPATDDYLDLAQDIESAMNGKLTVLLKAPMGSGKTTRAMIHLARRMNETIYITMPSRLLAESTLVSIQNAVDEMDDPSFTVGYKIDGSS